MRKGGGGGGGGGGWLATLSTLSGSAPATCYMYGPSVSITDRSVDMYTVHSFKNYAPVIVTWVPPHPIGANVGISTGFDTANWIVALSFGYRRAFDTEEADRDR